jgi:quercetin dioxygenase-like cupin family protein
MRTISPLVLSLLVLTGDRQKRLRILEQASPSEVNPPVSCQLVTFAPGARSAWHTHPLRQVLIITAGTGQVQMDGGPIEEAHGRGWQKGVLRPRPCRTT